MASVAASVAAAELPVDELPVDDFPQAVNAKPATNAVAIIDINFLLFILNSSHFIIILVFCIKKCLQSRHIQNSIYF